jgi:uncharacterized repeat protein (TIGR03803 family)
MLSRSMLALLVAVSSIVSGALVASVPAFAAGNETVLYSFANGAGGANPIAGLIFDKAGNLYGTTFQDGANNSGTVFQLVPGANGTWTETVLYSFCSLSGCTDGAFPYYGSLVFDTAGNLYGTTIEGGTSGSGCNGFGCGTVFELTPGGNGLWTETVLWSFSGGADGGQPHYGLSLDAAGNLYGTTLYGGSHPSTCGGLGCGVALELTPGTNGQWTETVLYNFCSAKNCSDGAGPSAGLVFHGRNLYGTAGGGANGVGVVFRLAPGNGRWTETVLYNFCGANHCADGGGPGGGLIFDAGGNIYGTTLGGGVKDGCAHQGGCGTAFKLTPHAGGKWSRTTLHRFTNNGKDGTQPLAGLVLDAGNLYGTTQYGGTESCMSNVLPGCGTVFKLAKGSTGEWTENVVHSFQDNDEDGNNPYAGLIVDASGNLYGTTPSGGTNASSCSGYGCGTVFEITP